MDKQPTVFAPGDIITPAELHKRLQVSRNWLYEQRRKPAHKRPPVIQLGKYLRIHWPTFCEWLAKQKAA